VKSAALLALMLGGCAATPSAVPGDGGCNAEAAQALVGQPGTQ
jgi:starvation-inducible outer membrane lipoprotein